MKELSRLHSAIAPSSAMAMDARYKQMKADGLAVLSFGAGEPDFETPEHIREAGVRAIREGKTRYTPAAGTLSLREAVAGRVREDTGAAVTPDRIVVSNGAKACLNAALMALLNPGDEVILPAPYWVSYPALIRLNAGVPVIVETAPERDYKLTPDRLEKAVSEKTKALILNNPCNPTGAVYTREELSALAEVCVRRDLYLVSDEVYDKLVYDGVSFASAASLGEEVFRRSVVVNGVSKTYAMTGWRIGYAVCGDPEIARVMSACLGHTMGSVGTMNQAAAEAALRGSQDCVEAMRRQYQERRDYLMGRLDALPGLAYSVPRGTFYLLLRLDGYIGKTLRGRRIRNGDDFAQAFLEQELVAVVSGRDFGAPDAIRWSYAASLDELKEGLDRLERFLT